MKKRRFWKQSGAGKVWTVSKRRQSGLPSSGCSVKPETSAVGGGRCTLSTRGKNEPAQFYLPALQIPCHRCQIPAHGNSDERNDLPLQESRMRPYFRLYRRSVKNAFPFRHARSGYSHSPVPTHASVPKTGGFLRRES